MKMSSSIVYLLTGKHSACKIIEKVSGVTVDPDIGCNHILIDQENQLCDTNRQCMHSTGGCSYV